MGAGSRGSAARLAAARVPGAQRWAGPPGRSRGEPSARSPLPSRAPSAAPTPAAPRSHRGPEGPPPQSHWRPEPGDGTRSSLVAKRQKPPRTGPGGPPLHGQAAAGPQVPTPGLPSPSSAPSGNSSREKPSARMPTAGTPGKSLQPGKHRRGPWGGQDPRPRQPQPGWGRASERARAGPARQRPATAPPLVWIRAASKEGLGNAFTYAHLRLPEEKGRIVPPGSGYKPEPGQWGFFFLKKQTKNPQKIQTNPTNKHKNTPHQKPNANKKQTTKTSLNQ